MSDHYIAISKILRKSTALQPDDIQTLRENCEGFGQMMGAAGTWANARLTIELMESMTVLTIKLRKLDDSVNGLNESSTALVTETNRLTSRILALTIAAVVLASIGAIATVLQVLRMK